MLHNVMHYSKVSLIKHQDSKLFRGLPQPLEVMRYHSLCVDYKSLPNILKPDAWSIDDQVLMSFSHRDLPIFGVQFHPGT